MVSPARNSAYETQWIKYIVIRSCYIVDVTTKRCYCFTVHPNVKLFISHGGISGVYEAVDAGVPVLGFPLFFDQIRNIEHLVDDGMAVSLNLFDVSYDTLFNAIAELINNEKWVLISNHFRMFYLIHHSRGVVASNSRNRRFKLYDVAEQRLSNNDSLTISKTQIINIIQIWYEIKYWRVQLKYYYIPLNTSVVLNLSSRN